MSCTIGSRALFPHWHRGLAVVIGRRLVLWLFVSSPPPGFLHHLGSPSRVSPPQIFRYSFKDWCKALGRRGGQKPSGPSLCNRTSSHNPLFQFLYSRVRLPSACPLIDGREVLSPSRLPSSSSPEIPLGSPILLPGAVSIPHPPNVPPRQSFPASASRSSLHM
jgi:hypothetical protein